MAWAPESIISGTRTAPRRHGSDPQRRLGVLWKAAVRYRDAWNSPESWARCARLLRESGAPRLAVRYPAPRLLFFGLRATSQPPRSDALREALDGVFPNHRQPGGPKPPLVIKVMVGLESVLVGTREGSRGPRFADGRPPHATRAVSCLSRSRCF